MRGLAQNIRRRIREGVSPFFDFIFPPRCLFCGKVLQESKIDWACLPCLETIAWIKSPICPVCGFPHSQSTTGALRTDLEPEKKNEYVPDHLCGECIEGKHRFDLARSVTIYRGSVREAIHRFKFGHRTDLSKPIVKMMLHSKQFFETLPETDWIIPVPLHRHRLRERGYNQAYLLSKELALALEIPVDASNLVRIKRTTPQIGLGPKQRKENVKNAFDIRHPNRLDGKRVLLVDDVFTTGNTLNECSRILRKAGADFIFAITVARVSTDDIDLENV